MDTQTLVERLRQGDRVVLAHNVTVYRTGPGYVVDAGGGDLHEFFFPLRATEVALALVELRSNRVRRRFEDAAREATR
jgi:hypothetical protein